MLRPTKIIKTLDKRAIYFRTYKHTDLNKLTNPIIESTFPDLKIQNIEKTYDFGIGKVPNPVFMLTFESNRDADRALNKNLGYRVPWKGLDDTILTERVIDQKSLVLKLYPKDDQDVPFIRLDPNDVINDATTRNENDSLFYDLDSMEITGRTTWVLHFNDHYAADIAWLKCRRAESRSRKNLLTFDGYPVFVDFPGLRELSYFKAVYDRKTSHFEDDNYRTNFGSKVWNS